MFAIITFSVSCKSDNSNSQQSDTTQISQKTDTTSTQQTVLGKEYTSKFICPNHCTGSGSDEAGICPVCGMEYIENPDYQ